jgi:hypothetical protein
MVIGRLQFQEARRAGERDANPVRSVGGFVADLVERRLEQEEVEQA